MAVAVCCHYSTYLANILNKENNEQNFPLGYGNLGQRVAVSLFGHKIHYISPVFGF